jgi:quercetin 2,3-dioxygenase
MALYQSLQSQVTLFPNNNRGHSQFDWLDSYHSFSFGNFYNPNLTNFHTLLVINDDIIAGDNGFGMHSHKDMEIITVVLDGKLEHKDSLGNNSVITKDKVQLMHAGRGITHSEFNHSKIEDVKLLQIWILPNKLNVEPGYQEMNRKDLQSDTTNSYLQLIASPNATDQALNIYQNAYLWEYNDLESQIQEKENQDEREINYNLRFNTSFIYIFVIEGSIEINGYILNNKVNQTLNKRDAIGISNISQSDNLQIKINSKSRFLLFELK